MPGDARFGDGLMDDTDRRIINGLQGGFPITERPFAVLGAVRSRRGRSDHPHRAAVRRRLSQPLRPDVRRRPARRRHLPGRHGGTGRPVRGGRGASQRASRGRAQLCARARAQYVVRRRRRDFDRIELVLRRDRGGNRARRLRDAEARRVLRRREVRCMNQVALPANR